MMPSGPGYWLDPRDGTLHRVATHNDWLLDPRNQATVGLKPEHVRVLSGLDARREIDEIRMIGVIAGLVRIRDYGNRISVQFSSPQSQVNEVLHAVLEAIPKVTSDSFPFLTIQNLHDDAAARMPLQDLEARLRTGEPVLQAADPIPYNETLRRQMAGLLAEQTC